MTCTNEQIPYCFFTVPINDGGQAEVELNTFLRSHKVLAGRVAALEQGCDGPAKGH